MHRGMLRGALLVSTGVLKLGGGGRGDWPGAPGSLVMEQHRVSGTLLLLCCFFGMVCVLHVCVGVENSKLDLLQSTAMLLYSNRALMLC